MVSNLSRRKFIKTFGASLGALSSRGFTIDQPAAVHFTHGVASGDPLADKVILWTRVIPGDSLVRPVSCRWEVATSHSFDEIIANGNVSALPERDFTVKVDAIGLSPGSSYSYRFIADGEVSPVGSTRTLPAGAVHRFKLAVASCSNYPQGYFHAYRDIAEADVDVVLHLGDYLYEYPAGEYVNPIAEDQLGRKVIPEHELFLLEDYRMRYGIYRTDPDLQAAHAAHPWITVWDDHEMMNDTWRLGAENHNTGEGDFDARINAAQIAYDEWMPIRKPYTGDKSAIYRAFQIGELADLILLDTRVTGRDKQLSYTRDIEAAGGVESFRRAYLNDSRRQLLGAQQENWLAHQLASSVRRGAIWQVLGQQVLMGKLPVPVIPSEMFEGISLSDHVRIRIEETQKLAHLNVPLNLDAWDGYPAARERLFHLLREHALNPISLAGDTHNGWAFNLANDLGDPVGVEWGTPGITSPGMEDYLPFFPEDLCRLLKGASQELMTCDTSQRGWTLVTLSPEYAAAQWQFVSSVLEPEYTIIRGSLMINKIGERRLLPESKYR